MHSWQIFISSSPFVYLPSEIDPSQHADVLHELVSNMAAKVYTSKRVTITPAVLLSYAAADLTVIWLDGDMEVTFRLPDSWSTRKSELFRPITNKYQAGTVIMIPPFLDWEVESFSDSATFAVAIR